MAPGLNMYNMNMNGNPWMQLASQSLGMLGGNSMGYGMGSFGGLTGFGGCNLFTNCYGEVNYDAVAGYEVANALINVGMQAWAANRADKEPEVNYTQELNKINKEIDTKAGEVLDLEEDNTAQQNKYDEAGLEITKLNGELSTAKTTYDNAAKAWYQVEDANPRPENYGELKLNFENAEKGKKELEDKIKAQEKIQKTAKEAIEANKEKIDKLNNEIKELKEKAKAYEEKVNQNTVLDTHIKGKKSDKSDAENWYSLRTAPGTDKDSCPAATQEQLKRAHTELVSAMKKGNAEDTAKWKKIFIEMYESDQNTFKEIPGYEKLYKAIKE